MMSKLRMEINCKLTLNLFVSFLKFKVMLRLVSEMTVHASIETTCASEVEHLSMVTVLELQTS